MRLLITIGLTLLVSGTWAQHSFFTIDSETDLLALPSDQLIDSDVELEAVESIVPPTHHNFELLALENSHPTFTSSGQLPFGARLPGYERIQYSYGYQIPEKEKPRRTHIFNVPSKLQEPNTLTSIKASPTHNIIQTSSASPVTTTVRTTTKQPTTPKFQSIYFPQPPELKLSLPETGYLPPAKSSLLPEQPTGSYLPPNLEVKAETPPVPSLSHGYLPPVFDFKTEPPPSPPTPPVNAYLPPNPDPVLKAPEPKTEPLPPPSGEYLPPFNVQRVPEIPLTLTLVPLPSPQVSLEPPVGAIKDNKEVVQVTVQKPLLRPLGVVGEHKEPLLQLNSDVTPVPPFGVVGEHEEPVLHFKARVTPAPPFGVIGEYEEPIIHFSSKVTPVPPYSVIGEHEEPAIQFNAKVTPAPPFGVIGENLDQPVKFSAEPPSHPPFGVIAEQKDQPIKFSVETPNYPPFGVIGEHEDQLVKFSAKTPSHPPFGVIGKHEELPVKFSAETASYPPFGVISESKQEIIEPKSEVSRLPPFGVISENKDSVIRAHAEQPTLLPFGVLGESKENDIVAQGNIPQIVIGAIPKDNPSCIQNHDCSEDQICMDGMCVNACVIAIGLCVGNAVCHARRHIPGCVCPDMFTAVTLRHSDHDQYDCMPMMMMTGGRGPSITQGRVLTGLHHRTPIANHRQNFGSIPLPALGVISERGFSQGRITTGGFRQSLASSDVCRPTPCGPNTRCEVSKNGIALCRCLDDFVPDGNTINGCKPQCVSDDECPDDYRCRATKCVRVCVQGACGINAECDARNHRAVCKCPNNYNGDPHINCRRERPEIRVAPPAPPLDPCSPSPCGSNADCTVRGERPVCTCPIGYEGDPLTNCRRGECIEANDCPGHLTCQRLRCIDPCQEGLCGTGSDCTVRNHQPICSCPRGFVGDPFTRCRRFDPQELCHPTPCGQNTNCKVRNDRAVCSCIDNYIGNPLTGCRPECVTDTECPHNMACRNNICVNPCRDACGEGAYCEVRNSRAVCNCPEYYQGDPYSRCFAECTAHDDCRSYQACFQLQCVDPCVGACGTGADCKVENHKPICSCPKGYTGHPFEACRPFTPADLCNPNPCGSQADCTPGFDGSGNDRPVCTCPTGYIGNPLVSCQRGECQDHSECRNHEACYAYICQNPCYTDVGSVCGDNAECTVKNHQPVCSCPPGYDGNPLTECRIGRGGGFTVGRSKK